MRLLAPISALLLMAGVSTGLLAFQWDPLESTCRHASLSIL